MCPHLGQPEEKYGRGGDIAFATCRVNSCFNGQRTISAEIPVVTPSRASIEMVKQFHAEIHCVVPS